MSGRFAVSHEMQAVHISQHAAGVTQCHAHSCWHVAPACSPGRANRLINICNHFLHFAVKMGFQIQSRAAGPVWFLSKAPLLSSTCGGVALLQKDRSRLVFSGVPGCSSCRSSPLQRGLPLAPARAHGCFTSACLFTFRRTLGKRIRWSRRVWRQHVPRIREGHMTPACNFQLSVSFVRRGNLLSVFGCFFSIASSGVLPFSAVESKSARAWGSGWK